MKLRFLGTSAGNPHPRRMTSSTLIEGPVGAMLLDAGEGCSQRLVEPGHWSQEVRTILITHRHTDHLSGLPMLLSGYKGAERKTPLEIVVHPDLAAPLRYWVNSLHVGERHLKCDVAWTALESGMLETAGGHTGFVWKNDHLRENDLGGSHSLKLDLDGQTWLFSGDLGSFASIEPYLEGVTVLVLESRHVDVRESAAKALQAGVRKVILTHVSADLQPLPVEGAIWAEDNLVLNTKQFLP